MFNTSLPLYGIMILTSLAINVIIILLTYNKNNFRKDEIAGALVYENIGILVGAKVLTYLQEPSKYNGLKLEELGLSSYGAIIGSIILLTLFAFQFKKNLKEMILMFMPPIPLMYAIGKIGCFLVGCCYGINYHGIGYITYKYSTNAPLNTPLFPIQIIETITFTIIFIYMIYNVFKDKFNLSKLGISFILCGLAKFSLDFLRASHINTILSLNQIISIIFIIIGIIIYIKNKK